MSTSLKSLRIVPPVSALDRARQSVRDCCSCIDASTPPAFCQRCKGCIDESDRPNWFPKHGADLEYLSWFPSRAAKQPGTTQGDAS